MLTVQQMTVKAENVIVNDLSFSLRENECLAIVGESGSGKSTLVKAMLRLLPNSFKVSGSVDFQGNNLLQMKEKQLRAIRGKKIAVVFQDVMNAFFPLQKIGVQMIETICEKRAVTKADAETIAFRELAQLNVHDIDAVFDKFPHELSGGLLQRCMIALSFSLNPDVLIADEPTTALDALTTAAVLSRFEQFVAGENKALLFITHDLSIVKRLAHSILVMKQGSSVEYDKAAIVLNEPTHPYTKFLVAMHEKKTAVLKEVLKRGIEHARGKTRL